MDTNAYCARRARCILIRSQVGIWYNRAVPKARREALDTISVVIATYNEEARIASFISGVSWADEVVVVDGMSSDRTAAIAAEMGARVVARPNQPIAMINKNIGVKQATSDWVLVLDSDEHVSATLLERLRAFVSSPGDVTALRIARKNVILGAWMRHGLRWPDYQTRFFRRGAAHFLPTVHGQTIVQGRVESLPACLEMALLHDPVDDFGDWVRKLTRYAIMDGQTMHRDGVRPSWWKTIFYPPALFLYDYVWRRSFLDGRRGLILAAIMAYYTFLKRVILWELSTQKPSSPSS
jgi:glycosyltransferase involved in cell wall biosynthesis